MNSSSTCATGASSWRALCMASQPQPTRTCLSLHASCLLSTVHLLCSTDIIATDGWGVAGSWTSCAPPRRLSLWQRGGRPWVRYISNIRDDDCVAMLVLKGSPFFRARWKAVEAHQFELEHLFAAGDCTAHRHGLTNLHGRPSRSPEGLENQRAKKRARNRW